MRYVQNSGKRYGRVVSNNNVDGVIREYGGEVFYFKDEEVYEYMSYKDLGFKAIDFKDMRMVEVERVLMWCKELEGIK